MSSRFPPSLARLVAITAAFCACGGGSSPTSKPGAEAGPARSCEAAGTVMGLSSCGPAGESCCTSLAVAGGTFLRSYDGVTFTDSTAPATVSSYRLDKYEVTVGRFRQFVEAVVGGWAPSSGAGKHVHLSGGGVNGGTERGWDASWTALLATTGAGWTTSLQCGYPYGTWTASSGANESLPINCETWYEAYAFCLWDGGFLPTEAEWNYASAGGSDQRVYPWSNPASSATASTMDASYDCLGDSCSFEDILAVGSDPAGNGKWGQSDLGGNVAEWNLDFQASYSTPCSDCASLTAAPNRAIRGGGFNSDLTSVLASGRDANTPTTRNEIYGVRCARTP